MALNDVTTFIKRMEKLSPAGQTALRHYLDFLEWQETQNSTSEVKGWSFSFIETFKTASVYASQNPTGLDVQLGPATVGGEVRPALWAHPPLVGQAIIEYHVPIPQDVSGVRLKLAIGIRDGAQISETNLVAFSVRVNGLRVWGHQTNSQTWQPAEVLLDLPPGDMARIEFATETLGSHEWTWAVWGKPELAGNQIQ